MPFDGTNLNEVQLTLIAARSLIKKGWCQRAFKKELTSGIRCCVIGAIREAVGVAVNLQPTTLEQTKMVILASDAFKSVINHPYLEMFSQDGESTYAYSTFHIETWNDERGRKKSEVLAAFDHAIASL